MTGAPRDRRKARRQKPSITHFDDVKAFVRNALKDGPASPQTVILNGLREGYFKGIILKAQATIGVTKAIVTIDGKAKIMWQLPATPEAT